MNKTRNDLVSYCLQSADRVSVCVNVSLKYEKLSMKVGILCSHSQSETETGSPKHVFFITVTTRLQSRDIQVTDSDIYLCTQVLTVTPSETACVSKGKYATKSVFNGQWGYIVGVYWFLLHPYTCVILDGTTGNRIVTISPETS